jgi:hypothetical protein
MRNFTRHNVTVPQLRRMVVLRNAGLSYGAIAVVVNLDWGSSLNGSNVRYWLGAYGPLAEELEARAPHGLSKDSSANWGPRFEKVETQ